LFSFKRARQVLFVFAYYFLAYAIFYFVSLFLVFLISQYSFLSFFLMKKYFAYIFSYFLFVSLLLFPFLPSMEEIVIEKISSSVV